MDQVLAALDAEATIALTQALIRIDSANPPGREQAVAEMLLDVARDWGLEADLQTVAEDRANVIIRLRGNGAAPSLLYCGHLDTVPIGDSAWDVDPFGGTLRDGRIFGRGASDMKSGVASMLAGMAAVKSAGIALPGDVIFAGVAGEEVDCVGSRRFLDAGGMNGVGWLVVSEPTNLDLVIGHKGAFRVEIVSHGRAAHGAMPELGINAILHMTEIIRRLQVLPLPHRSHALLTPPTVSINTISGGFRVNVVPDLCRITVDIRTLPEQDHGRIRRDILALLADLEASQPGFRATLSVIGEAAPVATAATDPLVDVALRSAARVMGKVPRTRGVNYFSDASVLQPPTDVPTVLFGPGEDELAHQVNESVPVDALVKAAGVFALMPLELFGDAAALKARAEVAHG